MKQKFYYERVKLTEVPTSRRSKHFSLINSILEDLKKVPSGSALRISLKQIGGIGLPNLRSALNRATRKRRLKIRTRSDEKTFYLRIV